MVSQHPGQLILVWSGTKSQGVDFDQNQANLLKADLPEVPPYGMRSITPLPPALMSQTPEP